MARVQVNEGLLEGEVIDNEFGGQIYSFKGVPYAQPPLGELRFKAPRAAAAWTGVRSARRLGPDCYQCDLLTGTPSHGSEDCLYLNVYSPSLAPRQPLPVMVWIHGGGFMCGSGSDVLFAPHFLTRRGVILVTINYRLEVLGFLCLDTEEVPGNAGMKDQVAALRWIKRNISSFGGDPENVTIFGESAGGASVSLHLLSPMSKGLFKRVISQSGTAISNWATSFLPRERSFALAKRMGCNSDDPQQVYEFFKRQPVESLINKPVPLTYEEQHKESPKPYFSVACERKFGDNEAFLTEDPLDLLRRGIHEGVEVMNGTTLDEGVVLLGLGTDVTEMIAQANKFKEFFVPAPLSATCSATDKMRLGKKIKEYYFKTEEVSRGNLEALCRFQSAHAFHYPSFLWHSVCARACTNTVYQYKFACKSERNVFKQLLGITESTGAGAVVCHADDLPYLFPITVGGAKIDTSTAGFRMVDRVTELWTNFAKCGNPTPDESFGVTWSPYTVEGQEYLEIGEELVPASRPDADAMEFWQNIYREHYPHYAP
ncbi:juvenile hormone esterase-like [Battus philenor]|uniref:juvenile hormone esterase-like n=1 Tax=Battus philenor TaxID=42288 RepID=UPI0035CFB0E3